MFVAAIAILLVTVRGQTPKKCCMHTSQYSAQLTDLSTINSNATVSVLPVSMCRGWHFSFFLSYLPLLSIFKSKSYALNTNNQLTFLCVMHLVRERKRKRERESESESVSLFVRPQALTNGGTITFVLINIICGTSLELCLTSLLFFYNHKMQMENSDMIIQWT